MRFMSAVLALLVLSSSDIVGAPIHPTACGLYAYRAIITRVIDGDTVVADIDLGFHTWRHGERLRLMAIDAPRSAARHALPAKLRGALSRVGWRVEGLRSAPRRTGRANTAATSPGSSLIHRRQMVLRKA